MWTYRLITESGDIYYYEAGELEEAFFDRLTYGGRIEDRNGKVIA